MLELIKYMTSGFWVFCGSIIILLMFIGLITSIIAIILGKEKPEIVIGTKTTIIKKDKNNS